MDSLLANNASLDEEEEEESSQQRNHQPSNSAPLGNSDDDDHILSVANKPSSVFSLPPPKSSSSIFSSLPAPKAFRPDPEKKVFLSGIKDSIVDVDDDDEEEEEEKEKLRKGSEPALQALSVKKFLSSLPVPKSSGTLGALPLGSGTSRRSILEANVPASSDSNEAQSVQGSVKSFLSSLPVPKSSGTLGALPASSDSNEAQSVQGSVKSFLSSLPVPKSSGTLGALPLGSGTSRTSILEANVPAASDSNEAQSVQGSTVSSSGAVEGGYQSEYVDPVGGYQQWGTEGESYPNYQGYTGYGNGDGQYSNWVGPNGEQYSNYASGYGNYGQFEHNWVVGSNASSQELPEAAESALRLTGKCGRNDATQQIVEVKQDELMKNYPEDEVRLTGIAFGPSYEENIMARSSASSNFQRERESIDNGEATPMGECRCGQQLKLITSWTNENLGRRFWLCPGNEMSRGCGFIQWFDPPMCERSKKIIPVLLERLNKQDEELKSLQMRLKLAGNGARTMDKYWFKSWRFKVVMLVIIVVLSGWFLSSGMYASSDCIPLDQLM